jgi:hypothetical protein
MIDMNKTLLMTTTTTHNKTKRILMMIKVKANMLTGAPPDFERVEVTFTNQAPDAPHNAKM